MTAAERRFSTLHQQSFLLPQNGSYAVVIAVLHLICLKPVGAVAPPELFGVCRRPITRPPNETPAPMMRFPEMIQHLFNNEDGPTTVEYAIILGVIVTTCSASLVFLGDAVRQTLDFIASALSL